MWFKKFYQQQQKKKLHQDYLLPAVPWRVENVPDEAGDIAKATATRVLIVPPTYSET